MDSSQILDVVNAAREQANAIQEIAEGHEYPRTIEGERQRTDEHMRVHEARIEAFKVQLLGVIAVELKGIGKSNTV